MKINLAFSFVLCAAIFGCASSPPPCSNPAGVASKVDDKHTVFGVALGQPLAIPECPKYVSQGYGSYNILNNPLCYTKNYRGLDLASCSPLIAEWVTIEFPVGELPNWAKSVSVFLVNSKAEKVRIRTNGISGVDEAYSMLLKKYGNPTSVNPLKKQNLMGAQFESVDATWKTGNISVTFFGEIGTIDSGSIDILTDTGDAYWKKNFNNVNDGKKSL